MLSATVVSRARRCWHLARTVWVACTRSKRVAFGPSVFGFSDAPVAWNLSGNQLIWPRSLLFSAVINVPRVLAAVGGLEVE